MKKHYWIIGIITAATILSVGIAGLVIEASPLERTSNQATIDVSYSNMLTTGFVAQELGMASDRVASVTVAPLGGGCSVSFNLPLRTDLDQTFDRNGNVVTQRARTVNELDRQQQERLDQLMETQGCFRARP
jgi:hypothetical protein